VETPGLQTILIDANFEVVTNIGFVLGAIKVKRFFGISKPGQKKSPLWK
jgi:hypothetical protein